MNINVLGKLFGREQKWQGACTVILAAEAALKVHGSDSIVAGGVKMYAPRTVSGRITHADGSAVPGAALTLIDQRGHQVSRATGSITGDFVLEPPAPGSYVLIVSAGGHQPAAVNLVVAGHPQRLDVPLQGSGELSGTVRVNALGRMCSATATSVYTPDTTPSQL